MTRSNRLGTVLGLVAVLCCGHTAMPTSSFAQVKEPAKESAQTGIGDALGSALKSGTQKVKPFPGTGTPGAKGLVQQSVWQFPRLKKNIQLAFVLDATNSMTQDIQSLKDCLNDVIEQIKGQVTEVRSKDEVRVWVAVVIYRDWWRKPQSAIPVSREIRIRFQGSDREEVLERRESPVEIVTGKPNNHFVDSGIDFSLLSDRLKGISLEVGHPGPEEQVDLGIGTALQELDWLPGDKVSRLLVVAGDAPPWKEEFTDLAKNPDYWTYWEKNEKKPMPLRQFTTRQLVDWAHQKEVSIFALACDKASRVTQSDHLRLGQMRTFFSELTQQTDGKFLDLSDPKVVDRLKRAVQSGGEDRQELRRITQADLDKATLRQEPPAARVAILPPLKKVDYRLSYDDDAYDDAYHVAALLTKQLQDIDPLLAASSDQVRRAWLRLFPDGVVTAERRTALAAELGVSFIIGGSLRPTDGRLSLDLVAYGTNGQILVEGETARADLISVAEKAWKGLLVAAEKKPEAESLVKTFSRLAITTDLAQTPEALRNLLKGYAKLEEATQFVREDQAGIQLSKEAMESFQAVLRTEPNSVFAKMLLASCQINLKLEKEAKATLIEARTLADLLPADDPLRLEVEADHAWYVTSDVAAAIQAYERILKTTNSQYPRVALRARWMLAGFYLSTLPQMSDIVPNEINRLDLGRQQILEILLNWPESHEAHFYGQYVNPPLPPRSKSSGPVRTVNMEHKIAVPLTRPKALLGGL
ncbi:MAG: hypothetical protein NT013_16175 [Planctomycetia bacterium]|nr:hypothetical protein [Planctomycetia bacterium]